MMKWNSIIEFIKIFCKLKYRWNEITTKEELTRYVLLN